MGKGKKIGEKEFLVSSGMFIAVRSAWSNHARITFQQHLHLPTIICFCRDHFLLKSSISLFLAGYATALSH